ncbi:hypothetical protein IEQ34_024650 [Dendrobium chrysotoxum]|uniref:PSII-K n=1 Tax=Dendrobium chrysotoxum TaxID=161865 RepID=A0AAV7FPJ2_DENCH|nr:hypothetical protein IEQ34_025356 [Dendrobium chrysotoxum]KAH0445516.1 hypothetical protein IEQ34_025360 [Dendrobium chrysotoxum]KAH0446516.1 hypothetical protein IEQ34_024650 [Dendrobium chrysotoxum]
MAVDAYEQGISACTGDDSLSLSLTLEGVTEPSAPKKSRVREESFVSDANDLGRKDSNLRVTGPKPVALPLGHAPFFFFLRKTKLNIEKQLNPIVDVMPIIPLLFFLLAFVWQAAVSFR